MSGKLLHLLVLAGVTSGCVASADSGGEAGAVRVENLTTLGQVWGFAKYHHPAVASGDVDWDQRLLDIIPRVVDAPDRSAAHRLMSDWIAEIGPVPPCEPCAEVPPGPELGPPIDWIRDSVALGQELSRRLVWIYQNRPPGTVQHYISHHPGVGNPQFLNEDEYAANPAPDFELRLLALYRFWNAVLYWFPYRDLIDDDLDALLAEFVPELLSASDEHAYRLAMLQLIARVKDTHANLWSDVDARPPGGALRVPVSVRFVEGRAVVVRYLHDRYGPETGLEIGDVIEAVDNVPVETLVAEWAPYYAASNDPTRLRDIGRSLLRGSSPAVRVAFERDGTAMETTAHRLAIGEMDTSADRTHDLVGPAFQLLAPDVAYLKLSAVVADSAASYIERARGTDVFVVDIRNYPSEFVVFDLGGHFVRQSTPFARFTSAAASNPGVFTMGPSISLQPREPHYEGRVVILVDEMSQSQSEYTAMAFRVAPGALVAGSTTAGADGNISPIPLPGGLRSMISGIGVFYPDGTPTQRVGIVPDMVISPTIAGIGAGRDEVLETAVGAVLGRAFRLGG